VSILIFSQLLLTVSGVSTTIFGGVSIGLHELGLLCLMRPAGSGKSTLPSSGGA
jgi:Fe-S cluster assembly ATPase SufC